MGFPTRLRSTGIPPYLQVNSTHFTVKNHSNHPGYVLADAAVPVDAAMFYFEITIERNDRGNMSLGFTLENLNTTRNCKIAYGLRSDGKLVSLSHPNGTTWSGEIRWGERHDTIGCGVIVETGEVFFTKNQTFLGTAYRCIIKDHLLVPCIGISGNGEIKVNFGKQPFVYSLNEILARKQQERSAEINKIVIPTTTVHNIVRNYLYHYGYGDTLAAFDEDNSQLAPALPREESDSTEEVPMEVIDHQSTPSPNTSTSAAPASPSRHSLSASLASLLTSFRRVSGVQTLTHPHTTSPSFPDAPHYHINDLLNASDATRNKNASVEVRTAIRHMLLELCFSCSIVFCCWRWYDANMVQHRYEDVITALFQHHASQALPAQCLEAVAYLRCLQFTQFLRENRVLEAVALAKEHIYPHISTQPADNMPYTPSPLLLQFISITLTALATSQPMEITQQLLDLIGDIVNACLLPESHAVLTILLSHLQTMKYQSSGKSEVREGLEWTTGRLPLR